MTSLAIWIIVFGAITFLLGLPLACRKVPMNSFYGFRVEEAMESEQSWFDINAYGGRQMVVWSWLIVAVGFSGLFIPVKCFAYYIFGCMPVIAFAAWRAVFLPMLRISERKDHR